MKEAFVVPCSRNDRVHSAKALLSYRQHVSFKLPNRRLLKIQTIEIVYTNAVMY